MGNLPSCPDSEPKSPARTHGDDVGYCLKVTAGDGGGIDVGKPQRFLLSNPWRRTGVQYKLQFI